jgi:hypothetical protein
VAAAAAATAASADSAMMQGQVMLTPVRQLAEVSQPLQQPWIAQQAFHQQPQQMLCMPDAMLAALAAAQRPAAAWVPAEAQHVAGQWWGA